MKKQPSIVELMRTDLINAGFRRKFIDSLNVYALTTLYDLWDVEDEDEQNMNVDMFIEEYGFDEKDVFD